MQTFKLQDPRGLHKINVLWATMLVNSQINGIDTGRGYEYSNKKRAPAPSRWLIRRIYYPITVPVCSCPIAARIFPT